MHHRNQYNKSKLVLYKPILSQLSITNKMEHFYYEDKCGICGHNHVEAFKNAELD